MPVLSCYVDDRTLHILQRQTVMRGMGETVEQLAEAAIESEAIAGLPGGMRGMHFAPTPIPMDLRGVTISMAEQPDGSIRFWP